MAWLYLYKYKKDELVISVYSKIKQSMLLTYLLCDLLRKLPNIHLFTLTVSLYCT